MTSPWLLLVLATQSPGPLPAPDVPLASTVVPLALAVTEPPFVTETPDGAAAVTVSRVTLRNDLAERVRLIQPLWLVQGPRPEQRFAGCTLAAEGPRPRLLDGPSSVRVLRGESYVSFLKPDLTLAPKEEVTLAVRCDVLPSAGPDATYGFTFAQALLARPGPFGSMGLATRTVAVPAQAVAVRHPLEARPAPLASAAPNTP